MGNVKTKEVVVHIHKNAASDRAITKRAILKPRFTAVPRPAGVLRSRPSKITTVVAEVEWPLKGKIAPSDIA